MNRLVILLSAIVLSSAALAQGVPPPRKVMLPERIFMVLTPRLKSEFNLTSEQRTRILDAFDNSVEVDGDRIMIRLTVGQDMDEMAAAATKVLDAAQQKRLEELWIQRVGGLALADDGVAKKVGLTKDQKKEADRLVEVGGAEIVDILSPDVSPETLKKISDIRTKYGKKIEALLSDAQRSVFAELRGKDGPKS